MRSVVLGTAGHVDHGKTVLVEALTGVNTDRWEEEQERGITIDLGFAPLRGLGSDTEISIVDVPGHEDFVKNMLAGATGLDLLLLVVAADEGPMPQTREHLQIARLLGIERGVAAVTKIDLVDDELRELAVEAVREELATTFGTSDWPIVPVSGRTGEGLEGLRDALVEAAAGGSRRRQDDLFRVPVDRAFTLHGVGTVVTGTVWGGRISAGSELRILPFGREARVRSIQVHGTGVEVATAGQRAAFALAGVARDEVGRGDLLTTDPWLRPVSRLDAVLEVLHDSPWPVENWQRVRFHLGTVEAMARVVLLDRPRLEPGDSGLVQIRAEKPVVARAADPYVIRFYSPITTIGGGRVLDPWARRRTRLDAEERRALLGALEAGPAERIRTSLPRVSGRTAGELAVLLGVPPPDLDPALRELERTGRLREVKGRWYDVGALERVREEVLTVIGESHARDAGAPGLDLEMIRQMTAGSVELIDRALADLESEGAIRLDGAVAAHADHRPRLDPARQRLAERARHRIREAGLEPPFVSDLAAELDVSEPDLRAVLGFLRQREQLVALNPDLYVAVEALEQARDRVRGFLEGGRKATPADFRAVIDVSRKYLIPLLEHLDSIGLTRRTPDGRVLRELD